MRLTSSIPRASRGKRGAYIGKPFAIKDLLAKVRSVLE